MTAREDLGVSEGSRIRRSRLDSGAGRFNTIVGSVFVAGLLLISVRATVSLSWQALLLWPAAVFLAFFFLKRARDQRPQFAWLEGSVLVVEDRQGTHRCDLATASDVRLAHSVGFRGDPLFRVLVARGDAGGSAVRFVMRDRNGMPLAARDLRLLATALQTSGDAGGIAVKLCEMAGHGTERTASERVDWRHRTGD